MEGVSILLMAVEVRSSATSLPVFIFVSLLYNYKVKDYNLLPSK